MFLTQLLWPNKHHKCLGNSRLKVREEGKEGDTNIYQILVLSVTFLGVFHSSKVKKLF